LEPYLSVTVMMRFFHIGGGQVWRYFSLLLLWLFCTLFLMLMRLELYLDILIAVRW